MLRLIPAAGRRLFLLADRLFGRLFGNATNPLYYLGTISCLMFALVTVSGFYLYAFYETGVDTTYASVERLTHAQWWLGGVMRSVHRYASDAMVLTMLLHLARHFCFDRYRSFRAFSWITGMVLLWLVYVSGVNGYMLPWDRLAQFTVVSVAEWFDALPVFRGTLVRNFILPEAISDRFFSLLQFLHIGIPLAALAALWIHVQRVPRARVMPPRPLAIGLALTLIALSLAWPVGGQGAAELASLPQRVQLDWFYLSVLPWVQQGHALALWAVVGGLTLLAFALPWLPPKRLDKGVSAWQVSLHPGAASYAARAGETLLDAGLRAELTLPYECRAGGCGRCRAHLLQGRVDDGGDSASSLTPEQRARGDILLCCACALSDVEIELAPGAVVPDAGTSYQATVIGLERMAPDVMKVTLALPSGRLIAYQAGQYIQIVLAGGQRRAYSFTAPSGETRVVELHVRRMPGGLFTTQVFERMQLGDVLQLQGPFGAFVLREPSPRPLIFVAGATGFAPVKSLLEQAFRSGTAKPMHLYWGVRRPDELYMRQLAEGWAIEHPNFRFVPVISEPRPGDGWSGRTGLVHEAILHDFPDLSGHLVYACGSVRMVQAARPAFIAQGLSEDACFSDAFTPATSASTPT
ncbi:MAG TPA: cytochrome b N-terminal domain-containing protein [Burkholderiaceae bacterium]|nr:cytochrome b N-terminal domain-containing protein [Burkholderiaceae bacterium]